jgi:phosphoribosylaminoimidazole-succinocarboxamide synthase
MMMRKRSSADFTFCCIAIDHFKRTPEETAEKLMEVSTKAKENGQHYAIGQAMRAAEKVAANPRSRSR